MPVRSGLSPSSALGEHRPVPEHLSELSDLSYRPEDMPADTRLLETLEHLMHSEGLPGWLAALPWIESEYSVGCFSRAGAAGPWQFMRETARDFGMEVDGEVDERYSWAGSSRGAASYLRYLYRRFGSWTWALAAYNCGEGVMARALRDGETDFTRLDLPGETDRFVPRFAAAAKAYRGRRETSGGLAVVAVPPGLDLRILAAEIGMGIDSLMALNRGYFRQTTPREGDMWELLVPRSRARTAFREAWKAEPGRYTVRSGDSWAGLAAATGVRIDELREANPGVSMVPGATISLPPPERYGEGELGYAVYIVRTGDTLSGIGAGVGAGSREVAEWNGIDPGDTIYPGQRLVLRRSGDGRPEAEVAERPEPEIIRGEETVRHTVSEGDTLWGIASRYGVTVEQIRQLNSLEGDHLSIGDVLVVIPE
jgi:membrane-bound lytic murein transglycosylase D